MWSRNTKIRKMCELISFSKKKQFFYSSSILIINNNQIIIIFMCLNTVKILFTFINKICHDKYVLRKR